MNFFYYEKFSFKFNFKKPNFFPDLADLAVYGVLSAIEGCDAFQDLLDNTKVSKWYYAVKKACAEKNGQVHVQGFDSCPGDIADNCGQ